MRLLAQKSGMALLTVLIAMMIISMMLFEFQYSAMVERKLAYNDLNQMQAYYLAKAGARMGLLRVALYGKLRSSQMVQTIKSKGMDITPYLDQIWSIPLPQFPPDNISTDKALKEDRDAAEKILQETKVSDGHSTHTITSESSKINLNYLVVPLNEQSNRPDFRAQPKTLFQYVGMMLYNVLQEFLIDSENPYDEYGNMKPEEIVMNIMDWVSPGTTSLNGGSKDSFYESQKPPYKAKKNRFYTIDELRLVKGIDEHLFEKMKPLVTVYSYDGKINLNTATKTVYRSLWSEFTDDDVKRIIEARDRQGGWLSEDQFVGFVAQDLNRPGFKSFYSDPKQYPFTVGSLSFMIEAMGQLTRSKSTIQKVIRVGVALTPAKGGQVTGETNPQNCNGNDPNSLVFWDQRTNQCKTKPSGPSDCATMPGEWQEYPASSGRFACVIQNYAPNPPTYLYPPGSSPTTPGASGNPATPGSPANPGSPATPGSPGAPAGNTAAQPHAMKILYWSES